MSVSYSSVTCCEEAGTRSMTVDQTQTTCNVTLRVNSDQLEALIVDLLGNRRPWPYVTGWAEPPRAKKATAIPWGDAGVTDGQGIIYEQALLQVQYDNADNGEEDEEDPETILNERLEPNIEYQQLDYRKFKWTDATGDPLLEAEAPGRPLYSMFLVRDVQKWKPGALPADLLNKIGMVNDVAYVSARLGLTFAKGTLLYVPPTLSHAVTVAGSTAWNVSMRFAYKPEGWNKFWRAKSSQYEAIWSVDAAAEYENYPEASLSALLF